jgi:glycosyltransferase involved in cell wall biosynthesis
MRLLYISIEFLEPIYSGNGALARMQVDELLKQGQEILLFCGNEFGNDRPEPERKNLSVISIPIQSSRELGINADFIGFTSGILSYWLKIEEFTPIAIIIDDWHSAMASIALGRGLKIPLFYQYFRIFSRESQYFTDPSHFKIIRGFEQQLTENAKLSIHLCKDCADWVQQTFKTPTKIIYPAIKPNYIELAKQNLITRKFEPHQPYRLVTFVRISPEKEIERLIQLVNVFDFDFRLLIMGETVNPDYKRKLDEKIHQNNLSEQIEFEGRFTTDSLINKLLECDAYIHPSRYEPFGISIMEAAYLGLPIILDRSPKIGAGELLVDGESCIRLDFENPKAAAQILREKISTPQIMREIGKKGQLIAQSLKIESAISNLLKIIVENS